MEQTSRSRLQILDTRLLFMDNARGNSFLRVVLREKEDGLEKSSQGNLRKYFKEAVRSQVSSFFASSASPFNR